VLAVGHGFLQGVAWGKDFAGLHVLGPVDNFKFVHGLVGLVGDNCKDESAEKCEAEAGGQHDVARRKGGFEFGFGFVGHGFGFGGLFEFHNCFDFGRGDAELLN
jgi:hypothetical protein